MKKTMRILYHQYLDDNKKRFIGGVESYIRALCELALEEKYEVRVYQYSKKNFTVELDGYCVIGVGGAKTSDDILAYICANDAPDYGNDMLIFATDFGIVKNKYRNSIAIQHGIAWDVTSDRKVSHIRNIATIFKGAFRAVKKYNRFRHCNNLVCVDYNFLNWYRTQVAHVDANVYIIPNFAQTVDWDKRRAQKDGKALSVVFARRLVDHRGTKLFACAVTELLKKYPHIQFTIAGEGPDERWLRDYLGDMKNVCFTKFETENSIAFHSEFDIAVVPTKGSEGTSLSLLEAMSAGCAVIATNVGGMTNIIIDGYNGLLISPDVEELIGAISYLAENADKRMELAEKGNETVSQAFSIDIWKEKWRKVLLMAGKPGECGNEA